MTDTLITITKKEYEELLESQRTLDALYAGGVDNWEEYSTIYQQLKLSFAPVAVSEHPWGQKDWLHPVEEWCWMGAPSRNGYIASWRPCRPEDAPNLTFSLPHWAIRLPEITSEEALRNSED